jgi:hypothetical protein
MGSPFASHTQSDPIELPFDRPNWIVVRRLTGREIEAAATAHRGQLTSGSAWAWPSLIRLALEKGVSDPEVVAALADPLLGYDRYALVRTGLAAWSYPQSITPVTVKHEGQPDQIVDAVDDLVDEAVDFAARQVLRLTKPGLFLTTEAEVEAAQKKLPAAASVA